MEKYVSKAGQRIDVVRPNAIHCVGAAKKLKPDAPLTDRMNAMMGIGLESDRTKYGSERLISYIEWMARHFAQSFFIIGDTELKFNWRVFGHSSGPLMGGALCEAVKARADEKREELTYLTTAFGAIERTSVLLWSELDKTKFDTSRWHGDLRLGLTESEHLREDVKRCIYGNMRRRLEAHESRVLPLEFAFDYERIVDYSLTEIAGILYALSHGINLGGDTVPVHVKVGPMTEGWYDKIVSRICFGSGQYRYRDSEAMVRIHEAMVDECVPAQFSRVYFEFPKETNESPGLVRVAVSSEESGIISAPGNRIDPAGGSVPSDPDLLASSGR